MCIRDREYPDNIILKNYFIKSSWKINISSDIEGTEVYVKYYKDSVWNYLGLAPIDSLRVPAISPDVEDFNLKLINGDTEYISDGEEYGVLDISII